MNLGRESGCKPAFTDISATDDKQTRAVAVERLALVFAKATGCGYGDNKDGKHCTILCDSDRLSVRERHDECDCRKGIEAVLAELIDADHKRGAA